MFKRIQLLFFACLISSFSAQAIQVDLVHPTFWWAGMNDKTLQVMLHGADLSGSVVSLSTERVKIDEVVQLSNPNYLLLYLNCEEAVPEEFTITLRKGKEVKHIPYALKERNAKVKAQGFDSSDVLYLIMPDRFANGDKSNDVVASLQDKRMDRSKPDARHGGDLVGITQHMDYLTDLGITAVWLNPVQENDMKETSYHGYAITDYYKVDERLGSNADFVELVDEAHQRGLKVVMDMIFNHCGSEHIFFKDKPTHDWFNFQDNFTQTSYKTIPQFDPYASDVDKDLAEKGWFVEVMPDLNQRNRHVAKYLTQNSIWWIEYAGIDGIRQDTHPYADFDFMANWCQDVRAEYADFTIVGETWLNSNVGISFWQENSPVAYPKNSHLPVAMDFPLMTIMNQVFDEETGDWSQGLSRIYEYLAEDVVYANPNNLLVFLDNHDTSRFNTNKEEAADFNRFRQAMAFLLTTRGIPQLYYGTEILMYADKKDGDGALRADFPGGWVEDSVDAFHAQGRTKEQNQAFSYLQKLLKWRKGSKAVTHGQFKHFAPRDQVYVYKRYTSDEQVLVFLNGSDREKEVDFSLYNTFFSDQDRVKDVLTGASIHLNQPSLSLPARGVLILELN